MVGLRSNSSPPPATLKFVFCSISGLGRCGEYLRNPVGSSCNIIRSCDKLVAMRQRAIRERL